jgi:hypothetical protein
MISTEKPRTSLSAAARDARLRSPRQQPDSPTSSYEIRAPGIAFKDAHFTGSAGMPQTPSLKVLNGRRAVVPEPAPGPSTIARAGLGPSTKGSTNNRRL